MPVNTSRSACCCATGAPAAWSYGGSCERCPVSGSDEFKSLCNMGPGYVEQPDGSVIGMYTSSLIAECCWFCCKLTYSYDRK